MPTAAELLTRARQPNSASGSTISSAELRAAFAAAKAPQAGDPAGKPLTQEEAALFTQLNPNELTWYARNYVLGGILAEIPNLVQPGGGGTGQVRSLPEKRGHAVHLSTQGGFALDNTGRAPADTKELLGALNHAGKWLQASFGSPDNLFKKAGLDKAGLQGVLAQFRAALSSDLSTLTGPQREQLLGSMTALSVELVKSIEFVPQMPAQNAELLALRDEAFNTIKSLLDHPDMSALVKRGIIGYAAQSDSFQSKLTPAQKADIGARHDVLFPKAPADYAEWERQGKNRIVIDHASGAGENFLYGFVKQLQNDGLDGGRAGSPKFRLISGNGHSGPHVLEAKIPANHPLNKWGREMTIELRARDMNRDIYRGMGDASVDVIHYGGHSNFGNNTLQSLRNAPPQNGPKIMLRDLCAGSDTRNAEAHTYPDAALNSVTSVGSTYFRTRDDPQVGKYAYASEGYEMLMSVTRGLLGKSDWKAISGDLQRRANWWGHDSQNNWTTPGDARVGQQVDDDKDGVPNVFDVLPGYDTTDVAGSTATEFELTAPSLSADEINGTRAFQAIQFVNTAVAYNATLQPLNSERLCIADPNGIYFDAKDAPNEYVKFRRGPNGERFVQLSSALSDMTIESLRAVVFFELVRQLGKENPRLFADQAERNGMALVFMSAALKYDDSWRDSEIYEGIKKLYKIPANVSLSVIEQARHQADEVRHNYTGDLQAARDVASRFRTELGGAGVGDPAITIV